MQTAKLFTFVEHYYLNDNNNTCTSLQDGNLLTSFLILYINAVPLQLKLPPMSQGTRYKLFYTNPCAS